MTAAALAAAVMAYGWYQGWFLPGWIQWCDSKHFYKKYYEDSIPIINTYYSLYKKSKYKKASYQFMTPNRKKINNKKYYNKNWHNIIHKKGE